MNGLNYGVIFRKHALLDNAEQYWYHTFKINLPSFHDIDNLSDICSGTIRTRENGNTCDQIMHTLEHLSDLRTDLRKEINDTVNEIKDLIPNTHIMTHRSRKVRAPFGFIGRFSKSAFGTATVKDLKILQKYMIQMVQQYNDLSDAFQNQVQLMTSFAGTVDHRFNEAVNGIANNIIIK